MNVSDVVFRECSEDGVWLQNKTDGGICIAAMSQVGKEYIMKQGNRGDMRKIRVTWEFFEARCDLIEKNRF